jgi:hypothetical protein
VESSRRGGPSSWPGRPPGAGPCPPHQTPRAQTPLSPLWRGFSFVWSHARRESGKPPEVRYAEGLSAPQMCSRAPGAHQPKTAQGV